MQISSNVEKKKKHHRRRIIADLLHLQTDVAIIRVIIKHIRVRWGKTPNAFYINIRMVYGVKCY